MAKLKLERGHREFGAGRDLKQNQDHSFSVSPTALCPSGFCFVLFSYFHAIQQSQIVTSHTERNILKRMLRFLSGNSFTKNIDGNSGILFH